MTRSFARMLAVAAPLFCSGAALAQDTQPLSIDATYSTEENCVSGVRQVDDDNIMYLDASGYWAIEYTCSFLQITPDPRSAAFVAVTACSEPGLYTPSLTLVQNQDGDTPPKRLAMTTSDGGDATIFYRCGD